MSGEGSNNWPWYHSGLSRMETERLLVESRSKDGSFLIRPSESMKGAYVLSLIQQQRIHHYRILPNEDKTISIQAQEGVQQKRFTSLEELVTFYSQPKRGIVCGLTTPIGPPSPLYEDPEQPEDDDDDEEDDTDADYDNPDEEKISEDRNEKERVTISKYLMAALDKVDFTNVDYEFQDHFKHYINSNVSSDIDSMSSATPELIHLKQLLNKEVDKTHKQLDKLLTQFECIQTLLDRVSGAKQTGQSRRSSSSDSSFEMLSTKLTEASSAVTKLETTAFSTYKDLGITLLGKDKSSALSQPSSSSFQGSLKDEISFEVKLEQQLGGKKNMLLTVKLKEGQLVVTKQGETTGTVYQHHQVSQLIKSRSKVTKLGVLFDGRTRKDYTFTNMQTREHFSQLIQTIRNKHRMYSDPDSISVFVGCWNMGDSAPPANITSWFKCNGWGRTGDKVLAHDIYAIGTQETSIGESQWITKLKTVLKSLVDVDYERVASQTLWGIRLVILVKTEHTKKLSHIEHHQVRTGIGNALGNKGAVGISLFFNNMSMAFINSHLTSGTEKCHRRNQNYHDILKGMGPIKHKNISQFDLTHQFHHLFFFGDLNYRVEMDSKEIIKLAKDSNISTIYCNDQLRGEMEKKKVFVGFEEAPIMFPPTYRFKKGERSMDSYIYVKKKRSGDRINEPSFCDRVLWRSYPGSRINNNTYGCTYDVTTSDHSPVFATFQIGGFQQFAGDIATAERASNTFIIFQSCSARIFTNSRTTFYIELHSSCFQQSMVKTDHSKDYTEGQDGTLNTRWEGNVSPLAKILPAFTDQEYLEQQYILLMIKSTDSDEPYAECCIALGSVINPQPQTVTRELIHQGLSVGELECAIHVTMDQYKSTGYDQDKDLYGNLDFIRQELEETSSLDIRKQVVGVSHTIRPSSSSNDTEPRPPMPIPRSGSLSAHSFNNPAPSSALFSTSVPSDNKLQRPPMPLPSVPRPSSDSVPPLPKRRGEPTGGSVIGRTVTTPTSNTRTLPHHPFPSSSPDSGSGHSGSGHDHHPPVPTRRGGNNSPVNPRPPVADKPTTRTASTTSSYQHQSSISGESSSRRPHPPVPMKRTKLPGDSPPLARSAHAPPTSPSLHNLSIDDLLATEGLQRYTNVLMENGYDSIKYINEISDHDLQELEIYVEKDRQKLLKLFQSVRS